MEYPRAYLNITNGSSIQFPKDATYSDLVRLSHDYFGTEIGCRDVLIQYVNQHYDLTEVPKTGIILSETVLGARPEPKVYVTVLSPHQEVNKDEFGKSGLDYLANDPRIAFKLEVHKLRESKYKCEEALSRLQAEIDDHQRPSQTSPGESTVFERGNNKLEECSGCHQANRKGSGSFSA
jgi:hypothetical protein